MSQQSKSRRRVDELFSQFAAQGDQTGWFEALYAQAKGDPDSIPWANLTPNEQIVEWLEREQIDGQGKSAVVVGCGLGDDAEALASFGFDVTAFDISATAIEWCKLRFPQTTIRYVAADLLNLPDDWRFDFVLEIYTVQALPVELRQQAIAAVAGLVAPGGTLLAIGRLVEPDTERTGPPWPPTKAELSAFKNNGLSEIRFEDYMDGETPPVRRFRIQYRRA